MVDLLVTLHGLVNLVLNWAHIPDDAGLRFENVFTHYSREWSSIDCTWLKLNICLEFFWAGQFSEPIILQSVSDDFDVTVPHVEEVTSVGWQIRPDLNGILVNSKDKVLLAQFVVDFYYWAAFEQHRWELFRCLSGFNQSSNRNWFKLSLAVFALWANSIILGIFFFSFRRFIWARHSIEIGYVSLRNDLLRWQKRMLDFWKLLSTSWCVPVDAQGSE